MRSLYQQSHVLQFSAILREFHAYLPCALGHYSYVFCLHFKFKIQQFLHIFHPEKKVFSRLLIIKQILFSSTHFNKIFSVFHFTINIQYICSKESRFPYMMVQLSVYFLSAYDHESFDVTHEDFVNIFYRE